MSTVFVPVPDTEGDASVAMSLDLSGYDPQAYNILSPVLRMDTAAPYLRLRAVEVRLSPDIGRGDCYAAPGTRWVRERGVSVPTLVAPAKPGLLKIASAAGLVLDPLNSRRITPDACERCLDMARATGQAVKCGECASRFDCAYQHIGAVRTDTGWRIVKASYEWNLDAQRRKLAREAKKRQAKVQEDGKRFDPDEYVEDRLDQITSERYGLAETKSLLRLVRAICHLRQAYSREEMARPFVVVRTELAPDFADPAVRQALAQKAIASGAEIFGADARALPVIHSSIHSEVVDTLAKGPDFSEAGERAEEVAGAGDDDGGGADLGAAAGDLDDTDVDAILSAAAEAPEGAGALDQEPAPTTPATAASEPEPVARVPRKAAQPEAPSAAEPPADNSTAHCDDCGKPITPSVVAYCQSPRGQATFGGKSYCYLCQRKHRPAAGKAGPR